MSHRYDFVRRPIANPGSIVKGECYRFTVLAEGLVRYEWAPDGIFEDRASTFAIFRDQPVPEYRLNETEDKLEIITSRFALYYDKQEFSAEGLSIQAKGVVTGSEGRWYYDPDPKSTEPGNLGGTIKTLDGVDGRIKLGPGVLSLDSFAHLDDSTSMLFDDQGWMVPRNKSTTGGKRIDAYVFAYGSDYKQALQAFYAVSGKEPLLPRWAFGNWWARYYKAS